MSPELLAIIREAKAYIATHPDAAAVIEAELFGGEPGLWSTADVMQFTGWGRTYVQGLVSNGTLPYIPGKPHKFIPAAVKQALEKMQTGGEYSRRKRRGKK
jgi:hypothetical protein